MSLPALNLNGIWKLADFDPGGGELQGAFAPDFADDAWIPARVPGDVHTALVQAGRIKPPFYDRNIEACRWVEEGEWWYRLGFENPSTEAADVRQWLIFDGLDTLCVVYLNGEELGRSENMFVPAEFDVTGRLRRGPNLIALRFDPISIAVKGRRGDGRWLPRALVRKAQYHFGWDWGPRLLTAGPWQGVRLETRRQARLTSVFFQTHFISAGGEQAEASVDVEVEHWAGPPAEIEVSMVYAAQRLRAVTPVYGDGRASLGFSIPFPALWWTHDLGTPALYNLEVVLRTNAETLDRYRAKVGLRTITWDQSPDPDEPGTHFFTPVLNGVRLFARGANWIPADSFLSEVGEDRYRDLLELAVEGNMNMLRAWGGGVYEKESFYRTCDELGLLVWQDFMYACALYPDHDPAFRAEAEREARAVVRRLRNHACLALWCGNNENDWLDDQSHWQEPGRDFPGKRICHKVLPSVLAELDPGRFYWPSSPYGGNDHNDAAQGDRHNWQVWHGAVYPRRFGQKPEVRFTPEGVSYRHYAEDFARFVSEFGMHAAPVSETLRRNVPAGQLTLGSEAFLYRNKDDPKDKGNHLMRAHTGLPANLEQYIDYSMIAQAEGLKFGIEHYRRRKPHCSGALFWQLNDCWPGLTWSVLDYYRFPKAGYFFAKRAYAPVLASFKPAGQGFDLWIVNDTLAAYEDELTWGHGRLSGQVLHEERMQVSIPPNSSRLVKHICTAALWDSPSSDYLYVRSGHGGFPANRNFLVEVKDLQRPTARFESEKRAVSASEVKIRLSSDRFVYFVKLECGVDGTRYSDNYLDLFPGLDVVLNIRNVLGHAVTPDDIRISALPA
jgi:beta-mannosidase